MYKFHNSPEMPGSVVLLGEENVTIIPADPRNIDYLTYLDWVKEGNITLPADPWPEPPTPPVLTPEEKLAQSGLTVAELKQLLGLT